MTVTSLVVDASVALKWYLEDEGDRAPALAILAAWSAGRIEIIAPSIWPLEVANAIRRAVTRKDRQLSKDIGASHVADFLAMGVATIDITRDIERTYTDALELGTTVYDMSYVQLAARNGIELVTADDRLFNAVAATRPYVKLLRDYRAPVPPG